MTKSLTGAVAIVGGSLAGLATGVGLARAGLPGNVFEQNAGEEGAEPDWASIAHSLRRPRASTRASMVLPPRSRWWMKAIARHRRGWPFIAGFGRSPTLRMDSMCTSLRAWMQSHPMSMRPIFLEQMSAHPRLSSLERMATAVRKMRIDAFIDTHGGGYVKLAVELGVHGTGSRRSSTLPRCASTASRRKAARRKTPRCSRNWLRWSPQEPWKCRSPRPSRWIRFERPSGCSSRDISAAKLCCCPEAC